MDYQINHLSLKCYILEIINENKLIRTMIKKYKIDKITLSRRIIKYKNNKNNFLSKFHYITNIENDLMIIWEWFTIFINEKEKLLAKYLLILIIIANFNYFLYYVICINVNIINFDNDIGIVYII